MQQRLPPLLHFSVECSLQRVQVTAMPFLLTGSWTAKTKFSLRHSAQNSTK
jgi:hypothetical protein